MLPETNRKRNPQQGTGQRFQRIKQGEKSRALVRIVFCQRVANSVNLCRALATREAKPLVRPAGSLLSVAFVQGDRMCRLFVATAALFILLAGSAAPQIESHDGNY